MTWAPANSVRRVDAHTVGVVIGVRKWYAEGARRQLVESMLAGTAPGDVRYSMVSLPEDVSTMHDALARLRALMPPKWSRGRRPASVEIHDDSFELAFAADELVTLFQPVYRVSDGSLRGFEALTRWHHPSEGMVPPASFIERLIDDGYAVRLIKKNLHDAAALIGATKARFGVSPIVSVNVTPMSLVDSDLLPTLTEFRAAWPDANIEIEIVESEDFELVSGLQEALAALKRLGYRIAIDDFGARYAWLNVLSSPIDTLKVNMAYIRRGAQLTASELVDDQAMAIIQAVIGVCASKRIDVIAEGVESQLEMEVARHLGVSSVQGYALGKPAVAAIALEGVAGRLAKRDVIRQFPAP